MLSELYSRLREVEREFNEVNPDGMNKINGYWFAKAMNKLRSLTVDTEQDMMDALGIKSVDLDD
jgi:hypothetical protein